MRSAKIERITNETKINLVLDLDGNGKGAIKTNIPFFDHMLEQLIFHSSVDLELKAQGDVELITIIQLKIVEFVWGKPLWRL